MPENKIAATISKFLITDKGKKFYSFSNTDGKQWIMPVHALKTAMNLYQPSGKNGILMKSLFPYLHFIHLVRQKLGISEHQYDLCNELKDLLKQLFKTNNIEFSLFCGTPSIHQKITMQVSHGCSILGYCKFTTNPEIKKIFKHEKSVLDSLYKKGIKCIPEVLYCDSIKDDIDIFVQTTTKTNRSKVSHKIEKSHWNFLSAIYEKTGCKISYEDSDFYKTLSCLLLIAERLPANDKRIITKAIEKVNAHYKNQDVNFCFYHGDFTPWNMFQNDEELFIFDWEYAQMTYPPYMDFFHFFTQTCFFEKHLNMEQIYNRYLSLRSQSEIPIKNIDLLYICYLLEYITLYLKRDKKNQDPNTPKTIVERIRLLSLICKEA